MSGYNFSPLWHKYPRWFLGYKRRICTLFKGTTKVFSIEGRRFYIPTSRIGKDTNTLPAFVLYWPNSSYSNRCIVIFHCGFCLHFPRANDTKYISMNTFVIHWSFANSWCFPFSSCINCWVFSFLMHCRYEFLVRYFPQAWALSFTFLKYFREQEFEFDQVQAIDFFFSVLENAVSVLRTFPLVLDSADLLFSSKSFIVVYFRFKSMFAF